MRKLLGQILIEKEFIDKKEIDNALKLQKRSNQKIGQLLVKKGVLTEDDLLTALSFQFDIEYLKKIEVKNIDAIKGRVSQRFVQKHRIIPFYLKDSIVKVAILDPLLFHPLDELRLMWIGFEVIPYLVSETEILRITSAYFDSSSGTSQGDDLDLEGGLELLDELDDLENSIDLANEAPIIKMVNVILSNAVSERASDIHIEPQEKELIVRYRVDGVLHKVLSPPKAIQSGILSRIKIMANLNIAENRLPQDGRIKIRFGGKDIDIRVSSLPTQFGERIVMRLLNKTDTKYELDSIGLTKETLVPYRELIKAPNGIILITGPTGSGKTSTLYASLTEVKSETNNIITVEDPVEYQIDGVSQVQAHHKIGLGFAEGLRSILRQDPDIIMVGEIRDEETARVAVQSALTGHLVFSTLHTNDAPSAVTRLLDMGIEPYLIVSTTRGFMAQRLVRVLCKSCRKPVKISAVKFKAYNDMPITSKKATVSKIFEPAGCEKCMNTGFKGRTGIYELLVMNNRIREMILRDPSLDELRKLALKEGMITLRQAALNKVQDGTTSLEEALRVT